MVSRNGGTSEYNLQLTPNKQSLFIKINEEDYKNTRSRRKNSNANYR